MENTKALGNRDDASPRPRADVSALVVPFAVAAGAAAMVILLFHTTFQSMASIWSGSGTYAHGFFILPISLFLIWDERDVLEGAYARPNYWALLVMIPVGFGWLLCRLAGINVLEQYAAVTMIAVALWTVLGDDVTKRILFPIGFLLLAVPIGDALLPRLIDQTAAFTVTALRLSGIPVLQDGNSLTLPTGRWSVVEACSGLRYLIASVTLGFLYAHLSYRSWWRRGLCLLASIIVPIVANWLRAYMIVMIGHLSGMKLAVGIDHLIYGWLFFGVVILLFFWVGSFFREDTAPADNRDARLAPEATSAPLPRLLIALLSVALLAGLWPVWAVRADVTRDSIAADMASPFPQQLGPFVADTVPMGWTPHYENADVSFHHSYRNGDGRVGLHVACYLGQSHGHELTASVNRWTATGQREWRAIEVTKETPDIGGRAFDVEQARIDGRTRTLAWKWFWIDGQSTVSPITAKLAELSGKLQGSQGPACGVTVYSGESDKELLIEFLARSLPEMEAALETLPRTE